MTPAPPAGLFPNAEWILLKKGRSSLQPDTWLATPRGHGTPPLVIKEFTRRNGIIRNLWAPWILGRERTALTRASQMQTGFTPAYIPLKNRAALGMEYIEGHPLPKVWRDPKAEQFFKQLQLALTAMHEIGLSHGDIRRTNIFVSPEGQPRLLDFASATPRYPFLRAPLSRLFHEIQRRVDLMTLEKIRRRTISGKEGSTDHYPWFMQLGRIWKKDIYGRIKKRRERRRGAPQRDLEAAPRNSPTIKD